MEDGTGNVDGVSEGVGLEVEESADEDVRVVVIVAVVTGFLCIYSLPINNTHFTLPFYAPWRW